MSRRSVKIGIAGGLLGARWAGKSIEKGKALAAERAARGEAPLTTWQSFRALMRRQYLWTDAAGVRHVGWRVWFLIWLVPGLFALATLWFIIVPTAQLAGWSRAEAVVSQVYAWEGETPFDRGVMQYAPLLCYTWTDGSETCATPGQRHRDWNFEVGSTHEILFDPARKANVALPGFDNQWALALAIGIITLVTGAIALYGHLRVRRWRAGGVAAEGPGA
jgi:hypothetical protein